MTNFKKIFSSLLVTTMISTAAFSKDHDEEASTSSTRTSISVENQGRIQVTDSMLEAYQKLQNITVNVAYFTSHVDQAIQGLQDVIAQFESNIADGEKHLGIIRDTAASGLVEKFANLGITGSAIDALADNSTVEEKLKFNKEHLGNTKTTLRKYEVQKNVTLGTTVLQQRQYILELHSLLVLSGQSEDVVGPGLDMAKPMDMSALMPLTDAFNQSTLDQLEAAARAAKAKPMGTDSDGSDDANDDARDGEGSKLPLNLNYDDSADRVARAKAEEKERREVEEARKKKEEKRRREQEQYVRSKHEEAMKAVKDEISRGVTGTTEEALRALYKELATDSDFGKEELTITLNTFRHKKEEAKANTARIARAQEASYPPARRSRPNLA